MPAPLCVASVYLPGAASGASTIGREIATACEVACSVETRCTQNHGTPHTQVGVLGALKWARGLRAADRTPIETERERLEGEDPALENEAHTVFPLVQAEL